MATPPNPLMGGGAPPQLGGTLSTAIGALANRASTNPGQDFSQQASQLQGADPSMILRQLESCKQMLGVLFIRTFQTLPNVANGISDVMKALTTKAIKPAMEAANVGEVVGKGSEDGGTQPPISFSPVQQGLPPGADQASPTT